MLTGRTPGALSVQHPYSKLSIETAQDGWVADFIFPPFDGKKRTGVYLRYTPASTHRVLNDRIAKGERPKEIEIDAVQDTWKCEEYGLGQSINRVDLEEADLADLRADSIRFLTLQHVLAREYRVAAIAGNTAIVPNATAAAIGGSGVPWSNVNGTPIRDITIAKRLIWRRTQLRANAIVIPYEVTLDMILTTEWRDTYRFTEVGLKDRLFEAINGLRAMGLEPMVSGVCGLTTDEGTISDPDFFEGIWGRTVIVFYRVPKPTKNTNCFGFQPAVRMDELLSIKSGRDLEADIVERWTIRSSSDELMVNANAGQLITAC
jgi:hypothetical protein